MRWVVKLQLPSVVYASRCTFDRFNLLLLPDALAFPLLPLDLSTDHDHRDHDGEW